MKMVVLAPVPKPETFNGLAFDAKTHAEAVKMGEKTMPYSVARENVKLSKGLYRMKMPEQEVAKQPELTAVEDLTPQALLAELTMYGKAPRKQMARRDAEKFLTKLRAEAVALIVDDVDDEDEDGK